MRILAYYGAFYFDDAAGQASRTLMTAQMPLWQSLGFTFISLPILATTAATALVNAPETTLASFLSPIRAELKSRGMMFACGPTWESYWGVAPTAAQTLDLLTDDFWNWLYDRAARICNVQQSPYSYQDTENVVWARKDDSAVWTSTANRAAAATKFRSCMSRLWTHHRIRPIIYDIWHHSSPGSVPNFAASCDALLANPDPGVAEKLILATPHPYDDPALNVAVSNYETTLRNQRDAYDAYTSLAGLSRSFVDNGWTRTRLTAALRGDLSKRPIWFYIGDSSLATWLLT